MHNSIRRALWRVAPTRSASLAPSIATPTTTTNTTSLLLSALSSPPPRPYRFLLSGGGVRNGLLWQLLTHQLDGVLTRTDEVGVPAAARKAVNFALLAALTLDGVPANLPSATGAAGSRLLGNLTPGTMANWTPPRFGRL